MRRIPPLNWLRAFEAVARQRSFSLAARELNVTQSAVSQHVKLLESYLKTTLFIRHPKQLRLTETGKRYLPLVSHAFSQLEAATDELFSQDKEIVRLQCDVSFSTLFLTAHLGDFQRQYPHITVQLQHSVWWQRRFESSGYSIQSPLEVRFGDGQWTENTIGLGKNTVFPVMSKQTTAPEFSLSALQAQPLYQLSGVSHSWRLWLLHAGLPLPRDMALKMPIQSDSSVILYQLAASNQGLSLLMSILAEHGLQSGILQRPYDYALPVDEQFYLTKPTASNTPAERLFAEWLLECCATHRHAQ